MSDETDDTTGSSDTSDKLDALLGEWESLQSDIRHFQSQYHRRIIRGTIVLAAVAGYAVTAPAPWLLIFIPIIIGLIFAIHVQESNNVYYRSWQCYNIEQELDIEKFDWTTEFAGLTRPNRRISDAEGITRYDLSWRLSPSGLSYVIGLLVYLGFAIYSAFIVIPNQLQAYDVFFSHHSWTWGVGFYVVLTLILVLIGYTHWSIRLQFKESVKNK